MMTLSKPTKDDNSVSPVDVSSVFSIGRRIGTHHRGRLSLSSPRLLCLLSSSLSSLEFSRLIRTSPVVDSFDVDALEIPGAQKNDIESVVHIQCHVQQISNQRQEDVIGALSLVMYTLILLPLVKYVFFVLWANDDGEGGTFALYSLICRHANVSLIPNQLPSDARISGFGLKVLSPELERSLIIKEKLEASMVLKKLLLILVLAGTAMVIADAAVTPAMSVMSAIGGLKVGVGAIEQGNS
ncbi:hypothetical protein Bca52824_022034 [Brassica carinata]|uniref:K+ potassium transporter integral membrane domain-containing protein n=1 Tax=Brassica carinata TaxID=52824 RepID=A0A8X8ASK4_BRACI|nr:hypothetical protein Bca52824_022034 [Brassica carinata]